VNTATWTSVRGSRRAPGRQRRARVAARLTGAPAVIVDAMRYPWPAAASGCGRCSRSRPPRPSPSGAARRRPAASRDARRVRPRVHPHLFARARRPARHGQRHAAARPADARTSCSATAWRSSPATAADRGLRDAGARARCADGPGRRRWPRGSCARSACCRAAGAAGMVGGQALDLAGRPRPARRRSTRRPSRHARRKTGALIRASALAGAIMAGGRGCEIDAIDGTGRRSAWRSRSWTTSSTSRAPRPISARPPARTRPPANRPTRRSSASTNRAGSRPSASTRARRARPPGLGGQAAGARPLGHRPPPLKHTARLDTLLVDRGLAASRERARALILAGPCASAGQPVTKAGTAVPLDADITWPAPTIPTWPRRPQARARPRRLRHRRRGTARARHRRVHRRLHRRAAPARGPARRRARRRPQPARLEARSDPRVVVIERVNART
jgi:hypothetical protein